MQQPVRQYEEPAQGLVGEHEGAPLEQVGCGSPLLPPAPLLPLLPLLPPPPGAQSAGISSLPIQYSQRPQSLKHVSRGVHVGHTVVSLILSYEHPFLSKTLRVPPCGSVTIQQPKQSQPLGTRPKQASMH